MVPSRVGPPHLVMQKTNHSANGHALWRAVDAEGEVLDVLPQWRRNKAAAVRETVRSTEHVVGLCASSSQRDNACA